jgi:plasmid stabilization system protein ParE
MTIKWNKLAVKNLLSAIEFIEELGYLEYAQKLESEILSRISELPKNYAQYPKDRFKSNNDGTYYAFIMDHYRISFRVIEEEIRIIRIRHTSRKPKYYKR